MHTTTRRPFFLAMFSGNCSKSSIERSRGESSNFMLTSPVGSGDALTPKLNLLSKVRAFSNHSSILLEVCVSTADANLSQNSSRLRQRCTSTYTIFSFAPSAIPFAFFTKDVFPHLRGETIKVLIPYLKLATNFLVSSSRSVKASPLTAFPNTNKLFISTKLINLRLTTHLLTDLLHHNEYFFKQLLINLLRLLKRIPYF